MITKQYRKFQRELATYATLGALTAFGFVLGIGLRRTREARERVKCVELLRAARNNTHALLVILWQDPECKKYIVQIRQ